MGVPVMTPVLLMARPLGRPGETVTDSGVPPLILGWFAVVAVSLLYLAGDAVYDSIDGATTNSLVAIFNTAVSEPPVLLAVTVYSASAVSSVVGVPSMLPEAAFRVNPSGKAGVTLHVVGTPGPVSTGSLAGILVSFPYVTGELRYPDKTGA